MKIDTIDYIKTLEALPKNIIEAEVNVDLREEISISVLNGKLESTECFNKSIYYIRASTLIDGIKKTGTVYTENKYEEPIDLFNKAIANASLCDSKDESIFNNKKIKLEEFDNNKIYTPKEIIEKAMELEKKAMKYKEVSKVLVCKIRQSQLARKVDNSYGFSNYQEDTHYIVNIILALKRKDGFQIGTDNVSLNSLEEIDENIIKRAIKDGNNKDDSGRLGKTKISSGNYSCVLSNQVVTNIIATAWQVFVGDYINKGKSVYKIGENNIGTKILNIIDAPKTKETAYNFSVDSQGTIADKNYIVKDGKLKTPLHTLESAKTSGQKPSGNGGRSALMTGTIPINILTIPRIIYIEPTDIDEKDLIKGMGTGLYLTYSLDVFHSINISSGEFSIPCGGIYYNDGKPIGKVEQITMAGNLKDLFNNITGIGNDLRLEEFIYKNYVYGGPSILVKELNIGAKEE